MIELSWPLFPMHVVLAAILFLLVNWIGKHAVDFGYVSTTLFEDPIGSVALNFFIRALAPAVFIILLSAAFVSLGYPTLRLGIVLVVPCYYVLRAGVIFLFNRQGLTSWPEYFGHGVVGIGAATAAYNYLILPNLSLIPNLEAAGNELWLAILAFLYAVANKIPLAGGPGPRRRNNFIASHYHASRRKFGKIIEDKTTNNLLKLVAFSVLVYEDYCRPPAIRAIERLVWWKENRTTGIMQVSAGHSLSDAESVIMGLDILIASWEKHSGEDPWDRVRSTLADYNRDEDYISRVSDVMEIIAVRVDERFKSSYKIMFLE